MLASKIKSNLLRDSPLFLVTAPDELLSSFETFVFFARSSSENRQYWRAGGGIDAKESPMS